jgi:hypothetical protein
MKRSLLFGLAFCIGSSCLAQDNFVSSGGDAGNGTSTVSYSIGQLVYEARSNASFLIIEGLQQSYDVSGALPVTLLYFKAVATSQNTVILKWTTVTELNSRDFTVERSVDGVNFDPLQTVPAAGRSTINIDYSVTDAQPHNGVNYYRLEQSDLDGKVIYSQIEKVVIDAASNSVIVGPNPVTDFVILNLQYSIRDKTSYEITNLDGQSIIKSNISGNTTRVNMTQLPKATYLLRLTQNGKPLKTFKIIKQ